MSAGPVRTSRRWRRVIVVILGLVVLYVAYRLTLRFMVEAKLNEVRKQGYPVTFAELNKWYPEVPTGENAADIYIQTSELYVKNETDKKLPIVGDAHTPSRSTPLPEEMKRGIADYLTQNQEALILLHKAARVRSCRYPSDLSDPENIIRSQMKEFGTLRQGARLLYLELLSASANGDTQRAVESVTASLALAESLRDRSLLTSYLVEKACLGLTISSLEQALSRAAFTEPQLAELSAAFRQVEATNSLTRALIGERAWANEDWKGIRGGKVSVIDLTHWNEDEIGSFDRAVAISYQPSGLIDLDYITYLDLLAGLINSSTIAFPQRFERIDSLKRKVEHLGVCPLTRMAANLLSNSAKRDARFIAQLRAVYAALEVERFRVANGALPDSLEDLVPKFLTTVPIDPFSGLPLKYKKLAKGYVVYGVGEDGEDNGGAEKNGQGRSYESGADITFTVER